jgi:hypothetical protein
MEDAPQHPTYYLVQLIQSPSFNSYPEYLRRLSIMDRLSGQRARKPKQIIKTSSALSGRNERKKIEMMSDSGVHVRKLGIESLANVGEKVVIFTQCKLHDLDPHQNHAADNTRL